MYIHIPCIFPRPPSPLTSQELELNTSPQKHIAEVLTPLTRLRTLRLNLDFPDTTGPRTSRHVNTARHLAWLAAARTRGLEVADLLEPHCPALEHAALLVHDTSGSYWWQFCPGGQVEVDPLRAEMYVCFLCVSMDGVSWLTCRVVTMSLSRWPGASATR